VVAFLGVEWPGECGDRDGGVGSGRLSGVVRVPVGSLVFAGSPRMSGVDAEHVRVLAEVSVELPPIVVQWGSMRVVDGVHRLRAAELRGEAEIPVRFFDGAEADAFVLAVQANVGHGLPLSLADRKAAAGRIVGWYPQWSDRRLASVTGLSAKTVAEVRRHPTATGVVDGSGARVGRDGRLRPVDARQRRELAGQLMRDNPDLSLREVARAVGVSPETVRAVRGRLRGGADPILPHPRKQTPAASAASAAGQTPTAAVEHTVDDGCEAPAASSVDVAAVVHQLRVDPALRFTETGRMLLRLLDVHAISAERWAALIETVPAHCRHRIANAALGCAQSWRRFAEQLGRDGPDPA
jgi:ParB-like chromosome segregation protein Spo0J